MISEARSVLCWKSDASTSVETKSSDTTTSSSSSSTFLASHNSEDLSGSEGKELSKGKATTGGRVTSKKESASWLTASNLATHTRSFDDQQWDQMEEDRIERVETAARDLGFELPRQCFEQDSWEMDAWLGNRGVRTRLD